VPRQDKADGDGCGLARFKTDSDNHTIPGLNLEDLQAGTVDLSRPFIIEASKTTLSRFADDCTFKKEVSDSLKLFSASDEKRHPLKGRGKLSINDCALRASVHQTGWSPGKVCGQRHDPHPAG
jgi:hypothetical protein